MHQLALKGPNSDRKLWMGRGTWWVPGIRGNLLAAPPLPACRFSLPWGWLSRPSFCCYRMPGSRQTLVRREGMPRTSLPPCKSRVVQRSLCS